MGYHAHQGSYPEALLILPDCQGRLQASTLAALVSSHKCLLSGVLASAPAVPLPERGFEYHFSLNSTLPL